MATKVIRTKFTVQEDIFLLEATLDGGISLGDTRAGLTRSMAAIKKVFDEASAKVSMNLDRSESSLRKRLYSLSNSVAVQKDPQEFSMSESEVLLYSKRRQLLIQINASQTHETPPSAVETDNSKDVRPVVRPVEKKAVHQYNTRRSSSVSTRRTKSESESVWPESNSGALAGRRRSRKRSLRGKAEASLLDREHISGSIFDVDNDIFLNDGPFQKRRRSATNEGLESLSRTMKSLSKTLSRMLDTFSAKIDPLTDLVSQIVEKQAKETPKKESGEELKVVNSMLEVVLEATKVQRNGHDLEKQRLELEKQRIELELRRVEVDWDRGLAREQKQLIKELLSAKKNVPTRKRAPWPPLHRKPAGK